MHVRLDDREKNLKTGVKTRKRVNGKRNIKLTSKRQRAYDKNLKADVTIFGKCMDKYKRANTGVRVRIWKA